MDRSEVLRRSKCQLPLLKVHPGVLVKVKMWPFGPAWFTTHWIGKRQVLCASETLCGCVACSQFPRRVIGFALVTCVLRGREVLFLLEVSPNAWTRFEMGCRFESIDPCKGAFCELSRPRARSPLRIEVCEALGDPAHPAINERRLVDAVAVLYGLPVTEPNEQLEAWEARVAPFVGRFAERAVQQAAG